MESLDVRFEGVVWLLQETKSAFYAPRYSQERLLVRSQVFSFWQQPQNVLELGEVGEYLVLTAVSDDASKLSGDPKETKKLLKITVRPLGDIRRAQLYQTADNKRVQENGADLASRLAALKNEKAGPAPPMDDLAERLRRLRGDNGPPEGMCVTEDVNVEKKNAVDRIIEQRPRDDEERPEIEDDDAVIQDHDASRSNSVFPAALTDSVAASIFPKSLHRLLQELKGDRTARDALRKLSTTSVSPAISRLTQACMQLLTNTEAVLTTSFEQDERFELSLRDSLMRLREIEDDRDQVAFELKQARDARAAMTRKFTEQRTRLEVQLRDTKNAADDILIPLARDREENLQALLSTFETQNSGAKEQLQAIDRTMTRVTQASQQVETDERKHAQHNATELRELLEHYDTDMERLDSEIEEERAELSRLDAASAKFEMHFTRIDNDRRNQLEEQRVFDLAERLRRNRETNMFYFIMRIQAVVRGFLARRKVRLEAERKKSISKKKGKTSKKSTSKSKTPKRKKPSKKKSTAKVRVKKP
ncbi:hypothetical protein JM16_001892 [Phytophthora kernoviae]|nr:hypothetical protein JM16_001892 [Phytophthora kernoviae]